MIMEKGSINGEEKGILSTLNVKGQVHEEDPAIRGEEWISIDKRKIRRIWSPTIKKLSSFR